MRKKQKRSRAASERKHQRELAEAFVRASKQLYPDFDYEKILGRKPQTPEDIFLALKMATAEVRESTRIVNGGKTTIQ
jgi:hypothetical protein